jgi:hypothetical protein
MEPQNRIARPGDPFNRLRHWSFRGVGYRWGSSPASEPDALFGATRRDHRVPCEPRRGRLTIKLAIQIPSRSFVLLIHAMPVPLRAHTQAFCNRDLAVADSVRAHRPLSVAIAEIAAVVEKYWKRTAEIVRKPVLKTYHCFRKNTGQRRCGIRFAALFQFWNATSCSAIVTICSHGLGAE